MYLLKPIHKHLFSLVLLLHIVNSSAAQSGNVLYTQVNELQKNGTVFTECNLLSFAGDAPVITGGFLLSPQQSAITKLYNEKPTTITLHLPTPNGGHTLLLMRSNPTAADIATNTIGDQGHQPVSADRGLHYNGCVAGQPNTLAAVSVFANGDLMVLFADKTGNYVVGKLNDNSNTYVLYKDDALKDMQPYVCKTKDVPKSASPAGKTTASATCKTIRIYLEGDFDLYELYGRNVTLTQNYLTGLFNQMQGIYKNDSIFIILSAVSIWTIPDSYCDTNASFASVDFQKAWQAKSNAHKGDFAILVAADSANNGGIAPLLTLCDVPNSYAYTDVEGIYNTIPTYSKDVMVISHELGHLLGSMHTHWCGWNTGNGGSCGAIDNCAPKDWSGSCTTCLSVYDDAAPAAAWSGTIMSYCHLRGRGINLANGFGPLPRKEMISNINNTSLSYCLNHSIKATLQTEHICRGEGKVTVLLDTTYLTSGLLPPSSLNYYWTSGATTQNLHSITTPGTYGVVITDAKYKCQIQYVTSVFLINTDSCRFKLGIDPQLKNNTVATISPNPCDDKCIISLSNKLNDVSITITDMVGRVHYSVQHIHQQEVFINTSGYTSGIYTITVKYNTGKQYLKLVVN